jgi:microsomal dipeptidase-like Zn-dependent dipeptidase
LAARGYPDEAIRGILGGNFLRVARETWGPGEGLDIDAGVKE